MPILDKKLALVAPFASGNEMRPALACVRLARKGEGIEVVATDSYTAARITRTVMPKASEFPILPGAPQASDLDGEILVPAAIVAATGKDIMKKTSLDVLKTAALLRVAGADQAELAATDLTTVSRRAFKVCDEKFPDLNAIMDVPLKGAIRVVVNAAYLGKIADMFDAFNCDGNGLNGVAIEITGDPSEPIRFTAEGHGHKAEALLMKIKS